MRKTDVEVLDVSKAGLMLATSGGDLRAVASSSETMRLVELFEIQSQEGPCPDCYRTHQPVLNEHLGADDVRWPRFSRVAIDAGFRSVHALPMRLRGEVIGALNLFRTAWADLEVDDVTTGQALADVATITILQDRAATESRALNAQLSHALESRIVIEQAKGVLAERAGLDLETAFTRMREYARSSNLKLIDVAQGVIDGTVSVDALGASRAERPPTD